MPEHCPRCGFKFERAPGHYVGAIGVSTVITFGLILITMLVGVAVTYPDVPFFPVAGACLAVAVFVPILIHPTARMMWIALDLVLDPLHDDEAPGLGVDGSDVSEISQRQVQGQGRHS